MGQADVTAARIMHKHEPAQGSRVLGYIKAPMILQVVESGIGSGRGVRRAQDKQETDHVWHATHGSSDDT